MKFFIVISITFGFYLKGFGQCHSQGVTVDNPDPSSYSTDTDYSHSSRKLYVVGGFNRETIEIGGFQLSGVTMGTDTSSMFIIQFSDAGVDWLKPIGKAFSGSTGARVKALSDGALVGVKFVNTVEIGNHYTSNGYENALLIRMGIQGNIEWVRHLESDGFSKVSDIEVDETGNIYVYGQYYENLTIDGQTLQGTVNPSQLQPELYLAKFTSAGELVWLKHLAGGIGYNDAEKLTCNDGSLYLTGFFSGQLEIGQQTLIASSGNNGFVCQTDTAGEVNWVVQIESQVVRELDVETDGHRVYVAGVFKSQLSMGSEVLNSNGERDAFVISLDNLGVVKWMKNIGGDLGDDAVDIENIPADLLLISGTAHSDFTVDGFDFTNYSTVSQWNGWAITMDTSGSVNCLYSYPSSDESRVFVEHTSEDTLWQVGTYQVNVTVGDTIFYCNGSCGASIFIAKTCMGCEELIYLNTTTSEKQENRIIIIPNPATTSTTITIPNAGTYGLNPSTPLRVTVMDGMGRVSGNYELKTVNYELDVSDWPQGIYAITATGQDGVSYTGRLVVVR